MSVEAEIHIRDRSVVAAYLAGEHITRIGPRFGMTPQNVSLRLKKEGVETRPPSRRKPMFAIVMARAAGLTLAEIAAREGVWPNAIFKRLAHIEAANVRCLRKLTGAQLAAYREALDDDRLPHPDALEIALEIEASA